MVETYELINKDDPFETALIASSDLGKLEKMLLKQEKKSKKINRDLKDIVYTDFPDGCCEIHYMVGDETEKHFFREGCVYSGEEFAAGELERHQKGELMRTYRIGDFLMEVRPESLIEDKWLVRSIRHVDYNPLPEIRELLNYTPLRLP